MRPGSHALRSALVTPPDAPLVAPDGDELLALAEHLPEGVIRLDGEWRVVYANRAAALLLGRVAEPLPGAHLDDLVADARDTALGRAVADVLAHGGARVLEGAAAEGVVPGTGSCRITATAGGVLIVLHPLPAVGAQRAVEQALSRAVRTRAESELLATVTHDIVGAGGNLLEVLSRLTRGATSLLEAEGAFVSRLRDGAFCVEAATGPLDASVGTWTERIPDLSARAAAERRVIVMNDLADERLARGGRAPVRHVIVTPMIADDTVLGVVGAVNASSSAGFSMADATLLQRLADHAAATVRNGESFAREHQRTLELSALGEIARHLNATLEVERVFELVARYAASLLGAEMARVGYVDGDDIVLCGRHGGPPAATGARLPIAGTFAGEAVRTRRVVRTANLRSGDWPVSLRTLGPDTPPNGVAAPLLAGCEVLGHVTVFGNPRRDFNPDDERLLRTLADHAAVAVQNARLHRGATRDARHAGVLAQTAQVLARHVTADSLYRAVAHVAAESLGTSGFSVYVADPRTRQAPTVYSEGAGIVPPALVARQFWDCAPGRVLVSGAPLFIEDAPADAHGAGDDPILDDATGDDSARDVVIRANALLPLRVEGGVRGVLTLRWSEARTFDADERVLLGDFATQVAVAMRNAELYADAERRAARLTAVARAQQAIAVTMLPADAHRAVQRAVFEVVDAPDFLLLLADGDATEPDLRVHLAMLDGRPIDPRTASPDALGYDRDAVIATFRSGLPRIAVPIDGPRHAGIAAPIASGGRVLGVLVARAPRTDAYELHDLDLLSIIGQQAGAAIEKGHLFERMRRERELAEAAAEISRLALRDETLPAVVHHILALVERVADLGSSVLAVLEEDDTVHAVAGRGLFASVEGFRPPLERSTLKGVFESRATTRIDDVRAHAPQELAAHYPSTPAVAVPLVVRDRVIGVLGGCGPAGHVLSSAQIATVARLAAPLALALDGLLLRREERRIADQLRQAEKLAALGGLVAGVAHELNNPLTGISAFAQLLLDEEHDEETMESVRLIKKEADRAVNVIRDLLVFSRKAGPTRLPLDVNELVERTMRLRAYALRTAGVELALSLAPDLPLVVGDGERLQQVVLNLVVNAQQAMEEGDSRSRRLVVTTQRESCPEKGDGVSVRVSDTGAGMTDDVRRRIFEPFFTTKAAGVGTGLGLSVSYGIVEAHGGTIAVESAPGAGSTFTVTLPGGGAVAGA